MKSLLCAWVLPLLASSGCLTGDCSALTLDHDPIAMRSMMNNEVEVRDHDPILGG